MSDVYWFAGHISLWLIAVVMAAFVAGAAESLLIGRVTGFKESLPNIGLGCALALITRAIFQ